MDKEKALKFLIKMANKHKNKDIQRISEKDRIAILQNINTLLKDTPARAYRRIAIVQVLAGGELTRSELEIGLPYSVRTIERGLKGTVWVQFEKVKTKGTYSKKRINKELALIPIYVYSRRDGHKIYYGLTDKGREVLNFLVKNAFDYIHLEGTEKPSLIARKNRRAFARKLLEKSLTPLSPFKEFEKYLIQKQGVLVFK